MMYQPPYYQEPFELEKIFDLKKDKQQSSFRWDFPSESVPAEFDKVEAVWLAWSFNEAKQGFPYYQVHLMIINALASHSRVKIAVKDLNELRSVEKIVKQHCPTCSHVSYHIIPNSTIWIRDIAPNFKSTQNGMVVVKFGFNQWGYADGSFDPDDLIDQDVPNQIAETLSLPLEEASIISDGGNREFNGKGTLLIVESVEKARNPDKTKEAIEKEYMQKLGVKKIIWLKQGLYEDDDPRFGLLPNEDGKREIYTPLTPGGHIDLFCRFASPNTILLAQVDSKDVLRSPIARENAKRLEENFEILKQATDQDGHPFEVIRMPAAEPFFSAFLPGDMFYDFISQIKFSSTKAFPEGHFPEKESYPSILGTSYLNFLICNDVVLTAKYWHEGLSENIKQKDEEAVRILEQVFPRKKIIPIDVYNVNLAGGGIHCMTFYEPAQKNQ